MKTIFLGGAFLILLGGCACHTSLPRPKALPHNWDYSRNIPIQKPHDADGHTADAQQSRATSLWNNTPRSLFGDRRASKLGDILTVVIEIDEEAKLQNSVKTDHSNKKNLEVSSFFGLPELAAKILPTGASLKPAVEMAGGNSETGSGNISRKEKLTLRLAARIDDVLPNGYLSLRGRQEIMVNNEVRYLQVTGIVRVADISRLNTITYDKIADARIFYGGRGQVTTATQSSTGHKIINKILPY